jgi:hypothetical protein
MPFDKAGPNELCIELVKSSIQFHRTSVYYAGHLLDLHLAPKDERGIIKVLEAKADGKVYSNGKIFFDSSTKLYLPGQPGEIHISKHSHDYYFDKVRIGKIEGSMFL